MVCVRAEITTWGRCSEKIVGATNRIKMKGQMAVFCSIFVVQFQR